MSEITPDELDPRRYYWSPSRACLFWADPNGLPADAVPVSAEEVKALKGVPAAHLRDAGGRPVALSVEEVKALDEAERLRSVCEALIALEGRIQATLATIAVARAAGRESKGLEALLAEDQTRAAHLLLELP